MGKHTTPTKVSTRRRYRSVVYIVLAIIVFLSPVVVTHWKNVESHRIAEEYSNSVAELPTEERDAMIAAAQAYNTRLPQFGAPDPWAHGPDKHSVNYQDYLGQLTAEPAMARIKIPGVGIDLPVYHGTDTSTLAQGVGHLYGTGLPVGGEGNHSVLTGHTGLATLTMFDNLTHMAVGDVFVVEVLGKDHAYRVDQIVTVLPEEVDEIRPEAGRDLVTLITCTPYGINSHRLLVRGERVPLESVGELDQRYRSPWQPWMIAAVIIVAFALIYLLWWIKKRSKNDKERMRSE